MFMWFGFAFLLVWLIKSKFFTREKMAKKHVSASYDLYFYEIFYEL